MASMVFLFVGLLMIWVGMKNKATDSLAALLGGASPQQVKPVVDTSSKIMTPTT